MHSNFKQLSIIVASFVLVGCGGGGGSTTVDTTAPSFTTSSTPSISENQTNVMTVQASDTSAVTYTISGGNDRSEFSLNSSLGTLTFVTAPDFEIPTDVNADNRYEVSITATDTSNNQNVQNIVVTITNISESTTSPIITITDDYQVESLGSANTINATVRLGTTPKSLYLVLSNSATSSTSASISHNAKVTKIVQAKAIVSTDDVERPLITRTNKDLQDFKSNMSSLLSKTLVAQAKMIAVPERREDIAGQSKSFKLDSDGLNTTTATARKVVSNISTNLGTKTLNIWVSDDSFDSGAGCSKSKCVTQVMVDALADTFLQSTPDNDIYDWVTNVYGEEWGSDTNGFTGLITQNNEITILLTDISNDNNPTGGIIGFFHPKDNFSTANISGSNERIMFYIDAVMFANNEGSTWELNDFWPKEIVATLAHEFQHMIHFYQKTILLTPNGENTDTWINEMLSESTEDLIATKIQHIGPRGVDYTDGSAGSTNNEKGRYPLFNANNTLSLTAWNNNLSDYAKVNAFGAYLLRNYGGAKVLHDIMHNVYVDEQAVLDAVQKSATGGGKTFANLLSEWGVAVLSSNIQNPLNAPTYNTGDFTPDLYSNITYELGSINFFNYNPQPTIYTTASTVSAQGNYYYKIGDNLTGDITIDLALNGQTEATLIAK